MPSNRQVLIWGLLIVAFTFTIFGNFVVMHSRLETESDLFPKDEVSLINGNLQLRKGALRGRSAKSTNFLQTRTETNAQGQWYLSEGHWHLPEVELFSSNWTSRLAEWNYTQLQDELQKELAPLNKVGSGRILVQLLIGAAYFCLIVSQYPKLSDFSRPSEAAIRLQRKNEVLSICDVSCPNLFWSLCCAGPRGAHTLDSTGILNYWFGLLFFSVCPCLTLCITNSCTDLNVRLGGARRGLCMSCLCGWCCSCCVIAQDAESLDLVTGVKTELCGLTSYGMQPAGPRGYASGPTTYAAGPATYATGPVMVRTAPGSLPTSSATYLSPPQSTQSLGGTARPISREELMQSGRYHTSGY